MPSVPVPRRYHCDLKIAAALGVLDPHVARSLPASTLHRFRASDYSSLVGLDLDLGESLALVKRFAQSRRAQAAYAASLRVKQTLVRILCVGRSLTNVLARHKHRVVTTIGRVQHSLGLRRTLKLFGLSSHRYTRWRNQVQRPCSKSLLNRCFKTYPGQLSAKETSTIKAVMADPQYRGWPVISIYWQAVRNQVIAFTRSTFYKYTRLLGLVPVRGISRTKDHTEGIRAAAANEIWHADITLFRTSDHCLAYIYLVLDNFSRRILSWAVDSRSSFAIHQATVREAYSRFIEPGSGDTTAMPCLITDGGSENVANPEIPLARLIAGRDIRFSNSMVEAVNKVVKFQSLYLTDIPDIETLRRHLQRWVPIYNDVRPHCAHGYLTPTEVHEGAIPDSKRFALQFQAARQARVAVNRLNSCPGCGEQRVPLDPVGGFTQEGPESILESGDKRRGNSAIDTIGEVTQ